MNTKDDTQRYLHEKRHKKDDLVVIIYPDIEQWRLNGKRHRIGGPAVIGPSGEQWWVNGKLHREDGPAVVYPDGTEEWWIYGKRLSITEIKIKHLNKMRDEDSRSVTELNMVGWLPLEMLNILKNVMTIEGKLQ